MERKDVKPGMTVYVNRYTGDRKGEWDNGWNGKMRRTVANGKPFTVTSVNSSGVRFKESTWGWDWKSLDLTPPTEEEVSAISVDPFNYTDFAGCCAAVIIYSLGDDGHREYLLRRLKATLNDIESSKSLFIFTTNNQQDEMNDLFESLGFHSSDWISRDSRHSSYTTKVKLWYVSIHELIAKGLVQ